MGVFIGIFSVLLGLALGSFMNVCIYRLPLGKSVVSPPSSCPSCGERIRFYDNIPLLSYLLLRGRCRGCGKRISWRYPLVEGLTGLLSLALCIRYGFGYQYLIFLLFSCMLLIISFIDLDHQIIPDLLTLPGIVIGFGVATAGFVMIHHLPLSAILSPAAVPVYRGRYFTWGDVSGFGSLMGILFGYGSLFLVEKGFKLLTGKEGMGRGDAKLLGMIGAWMGWKSLLPVLMISSLSGAVIGLVAGRGFGVRIPFGPFLSMGALAYLFFGPQMVSWYVRLYV